MFQISLEVYLGRVKQQGYTDRSTSTVLDNETRESSERRKRRDRKHLMNSHSGEIVKKSLFVSDLRLCFFIFRMQPRLKFISLSWIILYTFQNYYQ